MTRRRGTVVAALTAALLLLAACAAGPNQLTGASGDAGFWLGLWHGLISPITFLISLFDSGTSIYEVHNNGNWYDFGFMLGVAIIFSGPARLGGPRTFRRRAKERKVES